jgi:hypothetical protein
MTGRFRRAFAAASVTLALMGGLAACATGPDLAAEQSQAYRTQVVAIADSSAAGDYAGALAALDALQAEVDAAVADGSLEGDREERIVEAIALVRADLEAAIAAAATPEPAPAPTEVAPAPADGTTDNSGPGSGSDNSNTGKGEEKGKGDKGKGKD